MYRLAEQYDLVVCDLTRHRSQLPVRGWPDCWTACCW